MAYVCLIMLKIGVIGAGNLGESHLKLLKGINDFELVGFIVSSFAPYKPQLFITDS